MALAPTPSQLLVQRQQEEQGIALACTTAIAVIARTAPHCGWDKHGTVKIGMHMACQIGSPASSSLGFTEPDSHLGRSVQYTGHNNQEPHHPELQITKQDAQNGLQRYARSLTSLQAWHA
jgi:hypothetical protein